MANENDIFGISVQVIAGTRNEDKKIFKKSVGELAKAIDSVKIYNIEADQSKQSRDQLKKSVQTLLEKSLQNPPKIPVVTIKKFDCSNAMKSLKKDIEKAIGSISVGVTGNTVKASRSQYNNNNRTTTDVTNYQQTAKELAQIQSRIQSIIGGLNLQKQGYQFLNTQDIEKFLTVSRSLASEGRQLEQSLSQGLEIPVADLDNLSQKVVKLSQDVTAINTEGRQSVNEINNIIQTAQSLYAILESHNSNSVISAESIDKTKAELQELIDTGSRVVSPTGHTNEISASELQSRLTVITESATALKEFQDAEALVSQTTNQLTQEQNKNLLTVSEYRTAWSQLTTLTSKKDIIGDMWNNGEGVPKELLSSFATEAQALSASISNAVNNNRSEIEKIRSDIDTVYDDIQNRSKNVAFIPEGQLQEAKADLEDIRQESDKLLENGVWNGTDDSFIDKFQSRINNIKEKLNTANTTGKAQGYHYDILNNSGEVINNSQLDKYLANMRALRQQTTSLLNGRNIPDNLKNELSDCLQKFQSLNEEITATNQVTGKLGNNAALHKFETEWSQSLETANKSTIASSKAVETLRLQVMKFASSNPKAAQEYAGQIETILNKTSDATKVSDEQLKSFQSQLANIKTASESAGLMGATALRTLAKNYLKYGSWNFITSSMNKAIATVRDMINIVTELDTAMVELKKVTDSTDSTYDKYLTTATGKAKELGTTISDFVTSTADFARMGYDIPDATQLAEVATIYANVGDDLDGVGEASSDIISILKAFNMEASSAQSIVDKLNEVSNNYAVSSGDLGEGLKNSAASMAVAGNSLDETIALLTAMTEVTQSADESGNALKVLAMRLRGMSVELEKAGEDTEGMCTTTSELQDKIKALTKTSSSSGVDIMDNGAFRSTYDILKDIALVWDDLADKNKASLLELIAGKNRSNYASAVIQNIGTAINSLDTSENSDGSALKEHEKYIDSIEGKVKQFQAQWQELSTTTVSSDIVKGVVDTGSGLLGFLTQANELLSHLGANIGTLSISGVLSGLMGSDKGILQTYLDEDGNKKIHFASKAKKARVDAAATTAEKNLGAYEDFVNTINADDKLGDAEKIIQKQAAFANATADLNQELIAGVTYETKYAEAQKQISANADAMKESFSGIKSKLSSLGSSLKNIAAGIGNMLIIQGVMSAIAFGFEALDNYTNRAENNLSDLEKIATEINDKKDAYTSHSTSVNKIKNEYYELADGVNSYGENISLTSTQYERYIELSNEIAQMYPGLVKGYSAQNDAILECKNNVEALNKAMADEKNAYYETIVSKEQDTFGKALENIATNQGIFGGDDKTYITQLKNIDEIVKKVQSKEDISLMWADMHNLDAIIKGAGIEDILHYDKSTGESIYKIEDKDISTAISSIQNYKAALNRQINDLVNNSFKPVLDAYIHYTDEQFSTLDSKSQALIEQYINSATWDNFYSKIIDPEASTADNLESVKQTVSSIVKAFKNPELTNTLDEVQAQIDDIKSGKIDVSGFKDLNNKVINALSGIDGMNANTRELFVKMLFSDVEIADDVDINKAIANITKRVAGSLQGGFIPGTNIRKDSKEKIQLSEDVNKYLSTLDFSTIKQIYNSDAALNSLKDVQKLVEKIKAEASNGFSFKISTEDANKSLESTFSAFNTVKSAISEYSENGTLSFSTLQSLLSLDSSYIDMLINEQGELDLTSNKFRELAKAQLEKLKVSYLQASLDEVNQLENETQVLEYLKKNQQGATESALNLADAKWQEAYATAAAKDAEQGTGDLYQQAVITAETAWRKKAALIDYYESSLSDLSTTTDKATSATEKHKKALENEEKALEKTKEALENKKQALEDSKDGYEDALSAIEDLVDWTEKYIKQTKQNEIDALQERKDKIDELIEKKQELLDKEKEEADFNKQLKEKENAVASNALSAAITGLDDSSAGKKAYKENVDDLVESREDLYDYLSDYQYDTRKEALDKLKEETDKHYDDEIQTIQDFLNNEVSLHRAACNMIDNDNGTLYNNLLWYCQNYTTTTEAEFNHMWQSAQSALYEYGTAQLNVMDLMNTLQSRIYDVDSAIDNVTGSIDNYTSRIDSLKQKIDELGNSAQVTKAKIDSVKVQPSSITGHGYKITYNGKVYKTNLPNKEDAETYFISQISKDWYGGRALPAGSLWSKMKAYASGTKSAKGGLSIVDEEGIGSELIPTSLGNGRYTILPQGNPVFSKAMTNELFEFASAPSDYFAKKFESEVTPNIVNNKSTVVSPAININVQGDATQATVNALHKESEKIMNNTIKRLMSYTVNNRHL